MKLNKYFLLFIAFIFLNMCSCNNETRKINDQEYRLYLKNELAQDLHRRTIFIFIDIHCSDCLSYYIKPINKKLNPNKYIKFVLVGANDNEELNNFIVKLSDKFYVIDDYKSTADKYDLSLSKISLIEFQKDSIIKLLDVQNNTINELIKYCNENGQ